MLLTTFADLQTSLFVGVGRSGEGGPFMDEASVVILGADIRLAMRRRRRRLGLGAPWTTLPPPRPMDPAWVHPHARQSNPWSNDVVRPVALETGTPPSSNHAPARRDEQVDRKHKGSLPSVPPPLILSLLSSRHGLLTLLSFSHSLILAWTPSLSAPLSSLVRSLSQRLPGSLPLFPPDSGSRSLHCLVTGRQAIVLPQQQSNCVRDRTIHSFLRPKLCFGIKTPS